MTASDRPPREANEVMLENSRHGIMRSERRACSGGTAAVGDVTMLVSLDALTRDPVAPRARHSARPDTRNDLWCSANRRRKDALCRRVGAVALAEGVRSERVGAGSHP